MAEADHSQIEPVKTPPVLRHADMPDNIRASVFQHAGVALAKHKIEKDIAAYVKKATETEFAGTWHCIAGENFGASVTHETSYLVFFSIGKMNFLVFQSLDDAHYASKAKAPAKK